MTKKKNISVIAISILFLIVLFSLSTLLFDKEKITNSEPNWNCEYKNNNWECYVSFKVKNNRHVEQSGSLAIRGMVLEGSSKSGSVQIGEQQNVEFRLSGYQEKDISETIRVKKKPTFVNITILNLKTCNQSFHWTRKQRGPMNSTLCIKTK